MENQNPPERPYLKCIADSKKIHDNPVNHSPTKQLYSFPHSKRFNSKNSKSVCNAQCYDVNNKIYLGHQGTALGYGKKYDFTQNTKLGPGPNSYLPKNLSIEAGLKQKPGFSFGISKDQIKHNGMALHLKISASLPGPDAYAPKLAKSQKCTTLKSRIPKIKSKGNFIGPGSYKLPPSFQRDKPIIESKFRNTTTMKFPPMKSDKEKQQKKNEKEDSKLEAMTVDMKYQLNAKGVYFNSKYPNTKGLIFNKENRDSKTKEAKIPGPGNYLMPSEFGIYVSSKR